MFINILFLFFFVGMNLSAWLLEVIEGGVFFLIIRMLTNNILFFLFVGMDWLL